MARRGKNPPDSAFLLPPAMQDLEDQVDWEEVATELFDAFLFMRKQVGAALFPAIPGMRWYEACQAYLRARHPLVTFSPADVEERMPGRSV